MRLVVSDAGPLISLGRLDLLAVLPKLFAQVQVPTAVLEECMARPESADAPRIQAAVDQRWLVACDAVPIVKDGLGPGECAAIGRALQIGAGLLADDQAARQCALALGLDVIGTLGVLVLAKRAGHLPAIKPLVEQLRAGGCRRGRRLSGLLPPLKPIPIKDRLSVVFIERGEIDVLDGAFVVVDVTGIRTHIPVGGVACIMLEPGTRVSHRAAALAARVGTLLVWVGEAGVRLYSAGQPGGARSDRLLYQARLALDDDLRLKVVRKMYALRFGEEPPARRSVEQLRGIEGARVRRTYQLLAQQFGVKWSGRDYDAESWDKADVANRCLSAATSCLYGVTEAAVLAAGYAPAVGFIHTGKPLSFVYDIADVYKFETVVPVAFKVAAANPGNSERAVRLGCRDIFRQSKLLDRIIPDIETILAAGEIKPPEAPTDAVGPALPNPESLGDAGHRA